MKYENVEEFLDKGIEMSHLQKIFGQQKRFMNLKLDLEIERANEKLQQGMFSFKKCEESAELLYLILTKLDKLKTRVNGSCLPQNLKFIERISTAYKHIHSVLYIMDKLSKIEYYFEEIEKSLNKRSEMGNMEFCDELASVQRMLVVLERFEEKLFREIVNESATGVPTAEKAFRDFFSRLDKLKAQFEDTIWSYVGEILDMLIQNQRGVAKKLVEIINSGWMNYSKGEFKDKFHDIIDSSITSLITKARQECGDDISNMIYKLHEVINQILSVKKDPEDPATDLAVTCAIEISTRIGRIISIRNEEFPLTKECLKSCLEGCENYIQNLPKLNADLSVISRLSSDAKAFSADLINWYIQLVSRKIKVIYNNIPVDILNGKTSTSSNDMPLNDFTVSLRNLMGELVADAVKIRINPFPMQIFRLLYSVLNNYHHEMELHERRTKFSFIKATPDDITEVCELFMDMHTSFNKIHKFAMNFTEGVVRKSPDLLVLEKEALSLDEKFCELKKKIPESLLFIISRKIYSSKNSLFVLNKSSERPALDIMADTINPILIKLSTCTIMQSNPNFIENILDIIVATYIESFIASNKEASGLNISLIIKKDAQNFKSLFEQYAYGKIDAIISPMMIISEICSLKKSKEIAKMCIKLQEVYKEYTDSFLERLLLSVTNQNSLLLEKIMGLM